jgi:hypothetical protein
MDMLLLVSQIVGLLVFSTALGIGVAAFDRWLLSR